MTAVEEFVGWQALKSRAKAHAINSRLLVLDFTKSFTSLVASFSVRRLETVEHMIVNDVQPDEK